MWDVDVSRWVPVDVEISPNGRLARGGLTGKILKPPERGSVVGDGAIRFDFDIEEFGSEELVVLAHVLRQVPYLGRPTSPVLLDLVADAYEGAMDVWRPDDAGPIHVPVATPALLTALDQREAERAEDGTPGYHPRIRRPTARYRLEAGLAVDEPRLAVPAVVDDVLDSAVSYELRGVSPDGLAAVVAALKPAGGVLVPVTGTWERQGKVDSRVTPCSGARPGSAN